MWHLGPRGYQLEKFQEFVSFSVMEKGRRSIQKAGLAKNPAGLFSGAQLSSV
jgi:hypothetical protein